MSADSSPSLVSIVADSARQFPHRPALAQAADLGSDSLTYAELWDHVQRGAQSLRQSGLAPGDRILLVSDANPKWAPAFFSILHAGQVAVPVTPDTPGNTLAAIAAHAGASAVISSPVNASATTGLIGLRRFELEQLFAPKPRPTIGAPSPDLAMLAFTSGSTRQPLAVELTHANLLADLEALLQVRRAGPEDAFLSMLPPAHLFELMGGLLGPLACGAKILYPGPPLPNRLVESLRKDQITHACCVPGLLQCLYQEVLDELAAGGLIEPERRSQPVAETARRFQSDPDRPAMDQIITGIRARIGPSLRELVLGGAALDPAWFHLLNALGICVEIGYGLTEASPIVSLGLGGQCPDGSVGRPLPGVKVRIDASGEILLGGPTITAGYYRNPQATQAALANGWFRTGDRGNLDAEGFLYITGRLKEAMVTSAGETIYPEEVEPYYASPLFAEWCVAGRLGPQGNDLPTLFVVPAQRHSNPQILQETFQQLRTGAPPRFRLDTMVCLDQPLPRTALGKPRRRTLVATWQKEHPIHA